MPKSKTLPAETVLDGEILPPASASTATLSELSPVEFLALHGVRAPKPKAYHSLDAALHAIVSEMTGDLKPR
jgi:hypothetical protein